MNKRNRKTIIKSWLQESAWYKKQISSPPVTRAEPYCLYPTRLEISLQLKLFIGCSCSVRRPIFLCCLILSHSIFHGFKEALGWISLYSPSGAWYLCDPAHWFLFFFFYSARRQSSALRHYSCCLSKREWKKVASLAEGTHVRGPGDLVRGQGDCRRCRTLDKYVQGRCTPHPPAPMFAGKRICWPIQFPPGGCHGSFSLTFSVCANKQLQTDGADDAANSLKNGTQYRLCSPVRCTSSEKSI